MSLLSLPPVRNAQRYAGLYVYDFGTHVSVGFTAAEVRMLRESKEHHTGRAFQIYRVTEGGSFELRGVQDERLCAAEAICFLRHEAADARRDFESLLALAERHPLSCAAKLYLAQLADFVPPNMAALTYSAAASPAVSGWLSEHAFRGGDVVVGGIDVHAAFVRAPGVRQEARELPALLDYRDRTWEEVVAAVELAVQR